MIMDDIERIESDTGEQMKEGEGEGVEILILYFSSTYII